MNDDGKLSLDECRAITELSFGEGETESGTLEQLVIFPELANINITTMITDGNLSIGSIGGLNDTNISNVTGGTYPSDTAGIIKGIIAGTDIGCDYTMEGGRTIPVRFIPAEGSTFAPETLEGVEINAENFPDEVFREYVMTNFDTDGNGYLSQEECETVTEIDVRRALWVNGSIASLKGIENFSKLITLRCDNSELTELDVSLNTALSYLERNSNLLTSLDVSNNLELKHLNCGGTQITSLDVRNNTALTYLDCGFTPITLLDVNKNTALTYLDCGGTQIALLDVSKNMALENLHCYNTQITSLDVSKNTALTGLHCYNTQITSLDVNKNAALTELRCFNTPITSLDVSNNTALTYLNCDYTQIAFIDIRKISKISTFFASGCEHTIHVENGMFDLKSIEGFDIDRIVYKPEGAAMGENGVLSKIVKGTNIIYTYACKYLGQNNYQERFTLVPDDTSTFYNEPTINAENFPDEAFREYVFTNFDTDGNGYLSLTECNAASTINVSGKNIYSLDGIEIFSDLTYLNCNNTPITSLDVSKNTALESLRCLDTQIAFVDVSKNIKITHIEVYGEPTIHVVNGVFDFRSIEGFDISRIVGTVEGMDENGVISGITEDTYITYTYDCKGTGESAYQAEFTLVPDETSTFAPTITYPVAINSDNFPDEVFREYVTTNFDTDGNGYLSQEECENVAAISLNGFPGYYKVCTSLQGIENFTNLTQLTLWCIDELSLLDMRKNPKLEILSCINTKLTLINISQNESLKEITCNACAIPFVDISNNYSLISFSASGCRYEIPNKMTQFDVKEDPNFQGFNLSRVSDVQGADYNSESGIFDNFTANEITYTYDCKGTGESDYMVTFTLVRSDTFSTASISTDDEDDTPAVLSLDDTDTTPPPSSADTGADEILPEDAALPPEDIEGLRFLPLGILALMRDRKRKKLYVKRKAEI